MVSWELAWIWENPHMTSMRIYGTLRHRPFAATSEVSWPAESRISRNTLGGGASVLTTRHQEMASCPWDRDPSWWIFSSWKPHGAWAILWYPLWENLCIFLPLPDFWSLVFIFSTTGCHNPVRVFDDEHIVHIQQRLSAWLQCFTHDLHPTCCRLMISSAALREKICMFPVAWWMTTLPNWSDLARPFNPFPDPVTEKTATNFTE